MAFFDFIADPVKNLIKGVSEVGSTSADLWATGKKIAKNSGTISQNLMAGKTEAGMEELTSAGMGMSTQAERDQIAAEAQAKQDQLDLMKRNSALASMSYGGQNINSLVNKKAAGKKSILGSF